MGHRLVFIAHTDNSQALDSMSSIMYLRLGSIVIEQEKQQEERHAYIQKDFWCWWYVFHIAIGLSENICLFSFFTGKVACACCPHFVLGKVALSFCHHRAMDQQYLPVGPALAIRVGARALAGSI